MSLIYLDLEVESSKEHIVPVKCLFDSGASVSCVHQHLAEKIADKYMRSHDTDFLTADGKTPMHCLGVILLSCMVDDFQIFDNFYVFPDLSEEMIIGAPTMQKYRLKLDFEHDAVIVPPLSRKLQIV